MIYNAIMLQVLMGKANNNFNSTKQRKRKCPWTLLLAQCTPSPGASRLPREKKVNMALTTESTFITFLISGILGAKRCEICEITSWINVWFFIVLRAFIILSERLATGHVWLEEKMYRTIVAWITYLRSSSTAFNTSVDSALTSALIGKLRLTRIFFDLKPALILR